MWDFSFPTNGANGKDSRFHSKNNFYIFLMNTAQKQIIGSLPDPSSMGFIGTYEVGGYEVYNYEWF